jgi:hypothetical protein
MTLLLFFFDKMTLKTYFSQNNYLDLIIKFNRKMITLYVVLQLILK